MVLILCLVSIQKGIMTRAMRWFLVCLSWCCCCAASLSAAQLQFTTEKLDLKPSKDETTITAKFSFQNTGSDALTITKLEPSCGCLSADIEKMTFAAGERGEIDISFDTADLGGLQQKSIQIYYDKGAMILLHVNVNLADLPSISPTFLYWNIGDPATEKVATFTMPKDIGEYPTEVIASSTAVSGKLYHHDDGTWVISVTPTATTEATNVMLKINTNLGHTLRIFASIRK